MAYELKTSGRGAGMVMLVAVDPDTLTIKDFANPAVTADMSIGSGVTLGDTTWNGNARKHIQLAAGQYVGFGATKPNIKLLSGTDPTLTVFWIGETAGNSPRVFGKDATNYFSGTNLSSTLGHPFIRNGSGTEQGALSLLSSGQKVIFGFSLTYGATAHGFSALHDASAMSTTDVAWSMIGGINWLLDFVGRRNDNTTQQTDKILAIGATTAAWSAADWLAVKTDWFGELLQQVVTGVTVSDVVVASSLTAPTVTGSGDTSITVADLTVASSLGVPAVASFGDFLTDVMTNNTGSLLANTEMRWQWHARSQPCAAPTSVTYGTGSSNSSGRLLIESVPAGNGDVLVSTLDGVSVFWQQGEAA